tara:strand:+ start:95 stop:223 length:129 start_codon:yes stop_codon:yes gene_type:complete
MNYDAQGILILIICLSLAAGCCLFGAYFGDKLENWEKKRKNK